MSELTYIFVVTFYDAENAYGAQRQTGFFDVAKAAELAAQVNGTITVLTVA